MTTSRDLLIDAATTAVSERDLELMKDILDVLEYHTLPGPPDAIELGDDCIAYKLPRKSTC